MRKKIRFLAHAALIAALYAAVSYLQNLLLPGTASSAIQFRVSEALCILALFTPAAIPGLGIGCFVFNLSVAGWLPMDFLAGTAASALAAGLMWLTRSITWKSCPFISLLMPALVNGLIVGWELALTIGGGFWFNAGCVAIGEVGVLLTLGNALYYIMKTQKLDSRLFQ